eukprot:9084405-Pyramimonas_sp.AAC.1
MDSEVLFMVSWENLIRGNIPVWRSANDIVMTAGRNDRIPPPTRTLASSRRQPAVHEYQD